MEAQADCCGPHGGPEWLGAFSVGRWNAVELRSVLLSCRLEVDDLSPDRHTLGGNRVAASEVTCAKTPGIIVDADAQIRSQRGVSGAGSLSIRVAVRKRSRQTAFIGRTAKRLYCSHRTAPTIHCRTFSASAMPINSRDRNHASTG